jgi:hypothetical protein
MLKQILVGSSALVLLFAGSASAQGASELQTQERNMSQEQVSPDSATPEQPAAPQQQVDLQVDEEELQRFANAVEQIQAIEQTAQQEINQVLEQSGFSRERFSELYQAQQAPGSETTEATAEEQQSFDQAVTQIESILQGVQAEQVEAIQSEGLEPQRFSEILAAVRQDPSLQQQVQQMLSN